MTGGERLADHPAHRNADHVDRPQIQRLDQVRGVLGHISQVVLPGRKPPSRQRSQAGRAHAGVPGASGVTVVEPDHLKTALGQRLAEVLGPAQQLLPQPGDQQERGMGGVTEALAAERHAAPDIDQLFPVAGHVAGMVPQRPASAALHVTRGKRYT